MAVSFEYHIRTSATGSCLKSRPHANSHCARNIWVYLKTMLSLVFLKAWDKLVEQLVIQMKVANNFNVRNTLLHTSEKERAGVNQPVHWFLGDKGLGVQQGSSVWVSSPKSERKCFNKKTRNMFDQTLVENYAEKNHSRFPTLVLLANVLYSH